MKKTIIIAGLLLCALMAGCEPPGQDPGIVARVNGKPITLSQMQFKHDLMLMEDPSAPAPGVDQLRREYGEILGELVVQELMLQDLETRGLSVTDLEVRNAEEVVRADYPDGAFDQVIIEEGIDLTAWREQLRRRLAQEKFRSSVLRPRIRISPKEAQEYYQTHLQEFVIPSKLRLLRFTGPSREVVHGAASMFKPGMDLESIENKYKQVRVHEVVENKRRLPGGWLQAVKGLKPGQVSRVKTGDDGFNCFVFLEEIPSTVLDPAQAYPLVEAVLVEMKMTQAFDKWLAAALAQAKVEVSGHLVRGDPAALEKDESTRDEPSANGEGATPAPVDSKEQ